MGVGDERHAQAALLPRKRPGTHCIGGWVGLRAGLVGYGKSRPCRDSNFRPSRRSQVAIPTELSRPLLISQNISNVEKLAGFGAKDIKV